MFWSVPAYSSPALKHAIRSSSRAKSIVSWRVCKWLDLENWNLAQWCSSLLFFSVPNFIFFIKYSSYNPITDFLTPKKGLCELLFSSYRKASTHRQTNGKFVLCKSEFSSNFKNFRDKLMITKMRVFIWLLIGHCPV